MGGTSSTHGRTANSTQYYARRAVYQITCHLPLRRLSVPTDATVGETCQLQIPRNTSHHASTLLTVRYNTVGLLEQINNSEYPQSSLSNVCLLKQFKFNFGL